MRFSHARDNQIMIQRLTGNAVCGLGPTGSALAAVDAHPVSFPRSGCRRRRGGTSSLSVLPETWSRLSHSRSRSQAATTAFLSSARRRTKSRHAGGIPKGRALRRVFCPAFSARAEKGWPSETKTPRKTPIYLFKKSVYPLSASIPIPLIAACTSTGVQIVPPSS